MSGKTVLITGGNRGIGLEFVKHYVQQQYKVFATSRTPYAQVQELAAIIPISQHLQLDTGDESSIDALPSKLKSLGVESIDLLINNAGMLYSDNLGDNKLREMAIQQFTVNTLGPLLTTRAVLDYLKPGSKVVNITSRMGSIEDNGSGKYYGYRMSKTALNMATKGLAIDLKPKGISVGAIHPGFVQTGMTSGNGDITAHDSVALMVQVVEKLGESNSGKFFGRDGTVIPY
ncbi:hypothetical protein HK103_000292 [Boothiomyces macroporosus]|uniref:Short-chain dehydrogenase n=1 Tax=Boothiomyces macroporosus TaxID=261099 RepID=A0AAD5Y5K6_9FUNG|nr:hypothetical protein HK103_000270 [Boothiomyces macroporosus]KAJ3260682.1 hypothetical protein HK103_000292 [Boothiomyces macroporosus]